MAKIKSSAPSFDLTRIGGMLDSQMPKVTKRQETERVTLETQQQLAAKARRDALAISDQARTDGAAIRGEQMEVLNGIYGQIDKAQAAMTLSDSDNPMDRLNLWMLQQQDPAYTREGNTARLQYLTNAAGALGAIDTVQQAGYADQISRVQEMLDLELEASDDRLAVLKLDEAQGQELIEAEVRNQATRLGVLQNTNSMQQAALANMTEDQVRVASQQAATAPNQTASIGGVDISLAMLQDRQEALDNRRYNKSVMQTNLADQVISNLSMEQLEELKTEALGSKNRTAIVGGIKVPAGRIDDKIYELNNRALNTTMQKYQLNEVQENLVEKAQLRVLNTMQTAELEQIISNGFKDEDGIAYNQDMVRAARDAKADDDAKRVANQVTLATAEAGVSPATAAVQQIDSITANLPANSPILSQLSLSKETAYLAAKYLASDNPADVEMGHRLATATQEGIQAAVGSEAKRLSNGDKVLEEAYKATLTGNAIPADMIRGELSEKVTKGEPIGRWLSGDQNAIFVSEYRNAMYQLQQESQNSMFDIPMADLKAQAAEKAMNQVLNSIAAPISDEIMLMQPSVQGHPLNGIVGTSDFAAMMQQADQQGIEAFLAGTQMPEAEAAKVRAGQLIPPGLDAAQNARLYMALERKKPGLGDAYAQWWDGPGRTTVVQNYTAIKMQDAKGDFTKMSQFSLVAPLLDGAMGDYGNSFVNGRQQVYAQQIQKEHAEYITFGNNAQTKQIFLLEQTPGLTTQEKQIGMQQIIQPLIEQGKASGYSNADELTRFVETNLRSYEPTSPQGRSVLKKIMTGRDSALKVVSDFIAVNGGGGYSALGSTGILANQYATQQIDQSSNFPWYQELLANGVSTSGPAMNRGMN